MSLAPFVQILARGQGRARSMTQEEAAQAMASMLAGNAAPEAVGAILMLLRMKGETAAEIAGFAAAAQGGIAPLPRADLDWPSYAAGLTRGLPWFLLSARLVALAGHRVLIHGWNGLDQTVRDGLDAMEIRSTGDQGEMDVALRCDRIVYAPLETVHPALYHLLSLRDVLGLRSCINTVCRMLNPGHAEASVQGVFHPSYRLLQADAAALLGWSSLSVIKGGGGEFERHPGKATACFGLRNRQPIDGILPATLTGSMRLSDGASPATTLKGLWTGTTPDPFAQEVVITTAALALDTLGIANPENAASQLWASRLGYQDTPNGVSNHA